jgi:hypothetical protein
MDGHTPETLATLKNQMIDTVQKMFYEYNRMHEVVLQKNCEVDLEKRQMITTIRSLEETDIIRLATISTLEEDIRVLQKTNHEYSLLITSCEDKLAEQSKTHQEENKFSMIRIQAQELGNKDREIERLQKEIYTLKQKQGTVKQQLKEPVCGWSPTSSETPQVPSIVDLVLTNDPPCVSDTLIVEEVNTAVDTEVTLDNETETEDTEVTEDTEDTDDTEDATVEEADIFTFRKKEYYTIVGDLEQVVYELGEGDTRGKRLGTWTTTKKGNKKPVFDTA